jgi:histone H3/H4
MDSSNSKQEPTAVDASTVPAATVPAVALAGDASAAPTDTTSKKSKKVKVGKPKKNADSKESKEGGSKPKSKKSGPKASNLSDEAELLAGISKPACRRLFRQVVGVGSLRLADNATDSIRAAIGRITKQLACEAANQVHANNRQTMYMVDAKEAIAKVLPTVSVFV